MKSCYVAKLTKQSLTDNDFLWLIGVGCWVFNSNTHFIIELMDKEHHHQSEHSWFDFIKLSAGQLKDYYKLITNILGQEVYQLFSELTDDRNAIMHSFPTGEKAPEGYCVASYRNKESLHSVVIDKNFVEQFIKNNQKLSDLLESYRKKITLG